MKKVLVLLVVIASFFIFQTSLQRYDDLISIKFGKFTPNEQIFSFALSSSDKEKINEIEFQQNFESLLAKHNLNAYQGVYNENESRREQIVWAYTTDTNYLGGIVLRDGTLTEFKQGDYYFSYDGAEKGEIFSPFKSNNYKLYHLSDFSNPYQSIFNRYFLYTYGEVPEFVFNNFVADFKALYPDLSVFSASGQKHGEVATIDYELTLFSILTALMVIICLNIIIVKQTKKIQLLKQEGFSSSNIYIHFVLPYLGIAVLSQVIVMAALYFYYIDTSFTNAKPMLIYLLIPCLIFGTSLLVFSFISLYTISLININLAIKGKSSLSKQKQLNYLLKVILIVATTSIVLTSVNYWQSMYRIITKDKFLQDTDNLYTSMSYRQEYTGNLLEEHEEKRAVRDHFVLENDLFYMEILDSEAIGSGILLTTVSLPYIEKFVSEELAKQLAEDKNYILIPENLTRKKDYIVNSITQNYNYDYFTGIEQVLTYPKTKVPIFNAYDYLFYGTDLTNVVFFVGTTNEHLSGSYFTYDGSLADVNAYYAEVSTQNNTVPNLIINTIENELISEQSFFLQKFKDMLPVFIMIILTLLINTYQLTLLNWQINVKKYALLKSSGSRNLTLIMNEIVISFIILLLAETILYRFMNVPLSDLIFLILIYLVVDVIILWAVTSFKMRNFTERLK